MNNSTRKPYVPVCASIRLMFLLLESIGHTGISTCYHCVIHTRQAYYTLYFHVQALQKVSNVGWHRPNFRAIELFDAPEGGLFLVLDQVDRHTLAPKSTGSSDAVDVELLVRRDIVANDQADLLHIDTASPKIRRHEDAGSSTTELAHHLVTSLLIHVSVHRTDGELLLSQLVRQPIHLGAGVAKDDGLRDGEGVVKIAEGIELPFFLLDVNVKLLDALQREFVALDENSDGIVHEFPRHVQDGRWQSSAHQDDLAGRWDVAVDVVNLILEPPAEYLVCFVQDESLEVLHVQGVATDQIVDTTGRSRHCLDAASF
mmetsp:Transcript_10387/g.28605  ORF Transcript_10387/g.28605 Transcript_10387/m.28605 type:complete len:315 (+) Transcript_10387:1048-1992(+)